MSAFAGKADFLEAGSCNFFGFSGRYFAATAEIAYAARATAKPPVIPHTGEGPTAFTAPKTML
jgi:hypothetical protein